MWKVKNNLQLMSSNRRIFTECINEFEHIADFQSFAVKQVYFLNSQFSEISKHFHYNSSKYVFYWIVQIGRASDLCIWDYGKMKRQIIATYLWNIDSPFATGNTLLCCWRFDTLSISLIQDFIWLHQNLIQFKSPTTQLCGIYIQKSIYNNTI